MPLTSRLAISALLFSAMATICLADTHAYGDWTVTVAPDSNWERLSQQGVVDFALTIKSEELKSGRPSNEMFNNWSLVCRRKSDTPWALVLVLPYGLDGGSLTVNFDNELDTSIGISNGEVAGPELVTILKGMLAGTAMRYEKNGEQRSVSLRGVSAALSSHLDACPAGDVLGIKQELGI